jgi:antitoxin component of RelBE/YafQ-DinJ toxin-antitoxin module
MKTNPINNKDIWLNKIVKTTDLPFNVTIFQSTKYTKPLVIKYTRQKQQKNPKK